MEYGFESRGEEQGRAPFAYYDRGTPAERWERAGRLFGERRYAAAAVVLRGLVEAEPRQVAARLLLARSYYHSAQLGRAERELREVLELDPVEGYAQLMLGRTLQRLGRDAEAVRYLRTAAALDGDFPFPRDAR
ncbi:tetratricopeptide repeat protein [Streptomyces sp. NPDC058045]|uniref:tetratricopeptide repeat protein n=1 Tax=Streptomyces sp. NPDC058045 TaxID=3346311 RepID=UPI0036E541F2